MNAGQRFTELHRSGTFLLVNVHDAGTAALAEHAGAVALGTTSAGHAYSLGRVDGVAAISRGEAIERAAEICAAVDIPVSVDAENGWGHSPEEVAATIRDLAAVGAAGASIEDWSGDSDIGFYDPALALDRIVAAVEAARSLPEPFVICARAEACLYGAPDPTQTAIERLQGFAEAGADCLYAPGLSTRAELEHVVANAGGPINALCSIGGPLSIADATDAGARRISVGGSLYRATMATFHAMVTSLTTTGDAAVPHPPLTDDLLSDLFR
jgi:2-methylisocitrate lyase-like PEP mutase family enzyme